MVSRWEVKRKQRQRVGLAGIVFGMFGNMVYLETLFPTKILCRQLYRYIKFVCWEINKIKLYKRKRLQELEGMAL